MVSAHTFFASRLANSPHSPAAAEGTWSTSIQPPPWSKPARVTARWRAPLLPVIGVAGEDRLGAVELFGQECAG
jgi:hypothetical protein